MNRWKAILAAALIFATGAVTGALLQRAAQARAQAARDAGMAPQMMDGRFDLVRKLQRDLDLTPDQSQRIEAILQDGRKRTRQVWETCEPQMKEEMKRVRERIQAELTPGQKTRFLESLKRSKDRHGPRPEGGPRPNWSRERPANSTEPEAAPESNTHSNPPPPPPDRPPA